MIASTTLQIARLIKARCSPGPVWHAGGGSAHAGCRISRADSAFRCRGWRGPPTPMSARGEVGGGDHRALPVAMSAEAFRHAHEALDLCGRFTLSKWDHTPLYEVSSTGRSTAGPSGEGFSHFYGFLVFAWEAPSGERLLVKVNYAPHPSQCYVRDSNSRTSATASGGLRMCLVMPRTIGRGTTCKPADCIWTCRPDRLPSWR